MDKYMDTEMEQTSIYIMMSVFATQLVNEQSTMITYQNEDYHLVARKSTPDNNVYEIGIWRTSDFESIEGVLFALANFPGIISAQYEYQVWNSIPINQIETRAIHGPMHGVLAVFAYPEDEYELSNLNERAKDGY
jgi:hypothetical protein